jgi:hypothetical protein
VVETDVSRVWLLPLLLLEVATVSIALGEGLLGEVRRVRRRVLV